MAIVNLYQSSNMTQVQVWYGAVTVANNTTISIQSGPGNSGTYYGSFVYDNRGNLTGGTVNSYVQYSNSSLDYTVSGVNANAAVVQSFINAGDATGLINFLLSGKDSITGSQYNDIILGYQGNDTFKPLGGNDYIDGGSGTNTVVFRGSSNQYSLQINSSATIVSDYVTGRDGIDTLVNVQRLQFTDTTIALDVGPTQHAGEAYLLYQAAFNRAPDSSGLGYWIAALDNGADLVNGVASNFVAGPEFQRLYGSNLSNAQFVDTIYHNVLHRAGEASGMNFWTSALDHGVSRAQVLTGFAVSDENVQLVGLAGHGVAYTPVHG